MEDQTEDEEMPMSNDETPGSELNSENLLDEKLVEAQQQEQETEPESEILFETETTENGTQRKDEPVVDETEMSENNVQHDDDDDNNDDDKPTVNETETAENGTQHDEEPTVKLTSLPIARIRKIIKTDPEISLVNQEAVFLITKATELFIDCMTKESYKYTFQSKKKTIQKHDVQSAIDNVDALVFLDGV